MKRSLTILLILAQLVLHAQTYNNEWIDFTKTYYKFKIGQDGLYRIPQSVLANAGLANVPVQNFQLFRNGQEVPVYTSAASGILGPSDYIEFVGRMNDGVADKPLYRSPAYQHTAKWSLQTDTSVYFLTVNPTGATFHYSTATNDTTGNTLPLEPYFMYNAGDYYKYTINNGYAQNVGENIYSSSYDIGEFWSTPFIYKGSPWVDNLNNLYPYTSGPAATLKFGAAGTADTLRKVQVSVNGSIVSTTEMDGFNDLLTSAPIPLSSIASGTATVQIANLSQATVIADAIVSSFIELNYPRQFNFGGSSDFYFELPARASGYYLKISNFNAGAGTPVLYNFTTGQRYPAIVGSGSTFYFVLQGTSQTSKMMFVSEDPSNINQVSALTVKNFVNFSDPANQGNYIIISNPLIYTGSSNNNPVQDYKTYRNSSVGGGFNSQVVDIFELVDQFAFGIKKHPLAIKNFLNFARNTYSAKPQFVLLIGRGLEYNDYRANESDPASEVLNAVPTFGYPPSDEMLSSQDGTHAIALTPIGRLPVISGPELEIYLQKLEEYDQARLTSANNIQGRDWMKTVVHVTGSTDPYLEAILCNYMTGFEHVISDTLFGANVLQFCSTNAAQNEQLSAAEFPAIFSNGISMLSYFGHSSAGSLGFNLDDPTFYNNEKKYPIFYINGCYAGNCYTFDEGRLSLSKTLPETYLISKEKGSIAFVASSHYGVVSYLGILLNGLYNFIDKQDYGKQIGIIQQHTNQNLLNVLPSDFVARCHAEEMNIQGDPALVFNTQALPDYDIEASQVNINPAFISVSNNNFTVKARFVNLGKAVSDSVLVKITRKYPDGTSALIFSKNIAGIRYSDSISLVVPIVASRDKGQNYLTISINPAQTIPEITYSNNSITTSVFIYQDELSPIYPFNYAIINLPNQHLFASTANPFAPLTQYVMQIDTTLAFNSQMLVTKTASSTGGVLEFDPGFSYRDSLVYYWRTALVPTGTSPYIWNQFSFVYIDSNSSKVGFNQSQYFQHTQSTYNQINLDSGSRLFKYSTILNNVYIRNAIFPTASGQDIAFSTSINGNTFIGPGCNYDELIFSVLDANTFKAWANNYSGPTGLYGSEIATCGLLRGNNFDYLFTDSANRRKAMNFMDIVPDGDYVIGRFNVSPYSNVYINQWKADTSVYGVNTLYNRLIAAGISIIDSFTSPRTISFIYKKNDPSFVPLFNISQGIYDQIYLSAECPSPANSGTITSPLFGPAKAWKQLHWRGKSLETPSTDSVGLQLYGIDTTGNTTLLYSLGLATQDLDISSISAVKYPYLQLKMTATDTVNATPYQLSYWRLTDLPVPEGALAPNIFLSSKDTLQLGDSLLFGIAFKNISLTAFDSMRVNMTITDKNNVAHIITLPRMRPIVSGDTLKIVYKIDSKLYPGNNTIYLDVNPNNDQPEEFHFNNFLYKTFYVKTDQTNPLLDVTFDNVHILNSDIVSARPHIQIKLTDESKFLLLNDTSLVTVQVRYPDGSMHPFYFNTDTLRFTPATSGANNTATVDFFPAFTKQYNPQGDNYVLVVTGKDKSGNASGTIQYQVGFTIITKAMISNMLNYPNPFTTSTAFVFTITGSEVPQNIKIQIMTITGKVVREITKDELGPLHIGRNITEFKWNGTDMYGQRLAIGVYLYHVVTNLDGKSLDKYTAQGDNTNKFFVNGYGKMFLMK